MTTTTPTTLDAVRRDAEGFLIDAHDWSEELAPALAAEVGIAELTPRHLEIVRVVRARYLADGTGLTVRPLSKATGVSIADLYALFPKGPAKSAARIAGVPKPRGCI